MDRGGDCGIAEGDLADFIDSAENFDISFETWG
jgi:hypothetical protein